MGRFENHLKKNLAKINENLYISESDPLYYEKILRYADPHSPEAHYRLGQKHEKEGAFEKAIIHFRKATQFHSPYLIEAKRSLKRLEDRIHLLNNGQHPLNVSEKRTPMYVKSIIACLLFLLLIFLGLLLWLNPIGTTITNSEGTESHAINHRIGIPYVIHLPTNMPNNEIQKILSNNVINIGKDNPTQTIQLYGVLTSNPQIIQEALPLRNETLAENAFVIATFNPNLDKTVNIHFVNNLNQQEAKTSYPFTFVGVNIVRTALQTYINEQGHSPIRLEELIGEYPNNYLSYIPNEVLTASNHVSTDYTGEGGWVYDKNASSLTEMFYPNVPNYANNNSFPFPFTPVEILVDKDMYSLVVKSSPYIISRKTVGLGKNNSTPEGNFTIHDRVINPIGDRPKVFGNAGLGMGKIAIHGTFDENSINKQKSLGCIRLSNNDILDIYDFVPKGTTVYIKEKATSSDGEIQLNNIKQLTPLVKSQVHQTTDRIFHWAG